MKSKTTAVTILGAVLTVAVTIALTMGKITFEEWTAAMVSITTVTTTLVGFLSQDKKNEQ